MRTDIYASQIIKSIQYVEWYPWNCDYKIYVNEQEYKDEND